MPTVTINQTTFTFDHVYYVSTSGSDAANGSEQAPFLTVDQAVLSCADGGDAIVIGPGVFLTTRLGGTTDSGGVTDYGKSISFFGTPGETVFLCDGTLHTARDHHPVLTYGADTRFYQITFDVRTGERGSTYESALFSGIGATQRCFAAVYNCVFVVDDDASFLYDNTNESWVTLSYCSFLMSGHFANSYSSGGRYQLLNCASTSEWPAEYIGTTSIEGCLLTGFYELTGGYNDSHLMIPKLSSGTSVLSSGEYSVYYDWKVFDRERSTRWISSTTAPYFVAYTGAALLAVNFYTITPGWFDRAPKTFSVQGFNGSSWVTIDSKTDYRDWNYRETKVFVLPNTVSYYGFRLEIESVQNDIRTELYAFNVGYRGDVNAPKGVYGGSFKWNLNTFLVQTENEVISYPLIQSSFFVSKSKSRLTFERYTYTGNITIEALVSTTSTDASSNIENPALTILGDRDPSCAFSFGVSGGMLTYKTKGSLWQFHTAFLTPINDGVEHHVAVTHGSGEVKLYLDGELIYTSATSIPPSISPSIIGGGYGDVDFFDGSIREVRVWNVVRTQVQLQEQVSSTLTGFENGLVAYFPMRSTTTYCDFPSITINRRYVLGTSYYLQSGYVPGRPRVLSGPVTQALFETHGFPSLRSLTTSHIGFLPTQFEVLTWSHDETPTISLEGSSLPRAAIQTTDVQYPGSIDGPFVLSPVLDASMCRVVMSGNQGQTWHAYTNGVWEVISDLSADIIFHQARGMTVAEVNTIPLSALLELGTTYRFAYVLVLADGVSPALDTLQVTAKNTVTTPMLQSISLSYTEIDIRYYGLIFMDASNNVYSLSDGTVLRYFDFGDLTAGQDTLEVPIKIKNGYNFSLTNIQVSQHDLPYGAIMELSKTLAPFTPSDELVFTDVMDPDDVYTFYIRLKTDYDASVGGIFALKAKASVVVS